MSYTYGRALGVLCIQHLTRKQYQDQMMCSIETCSEAKNNKCKVKALVSFPQRGRGSMQVTQGRPCWAHVRSLRYINKHSKAGFVGTSVGGFVVGIIAMAGRC